MAKGKDKDKLGAGEVVGGVILMPLGLAGVAARFLRRMDRLSVVRRRTPHRAWRRLRGQHRAR